MIHDIINNQLAKNLNNQLEQLVVEGLKRKGFEFNTKTELETFVKERVTRTDNTEFKEHIYFVDAIPFFLHRYEPVYSPITENNNGIIITANWGSYDFL